MRLGLGCAVLLSVVGVNLGRAGVFVDTVIDYDKGAISGTGSLQVNGNAAIGLPTSSDDGQTTPFTPPFRASSIVIVGAGGHITLHFYSPVVTGPGAEIGVFTNTGLVATTVNGVVSATSGPGVFSTDAAIVSVSADGNSWFALNGGNVLDLTMPSNAFLDSTLSASGGVKASGGTIGSDPYKPFNATLSQFANLTYPQMVTLFDSSFGGAWIDASGSGLGEINYIRFDVPAGKRLVLDAVTGVPEPASLGVAVAGMIALLVRGSRKERK